MPTRGKPDLSQPIMPAKPAGFQGRMSRRAARCTEADLKRAIKAALSAGTSPVIEIPAQGAIRVIAAGVEMQPLEQPQPPGFVYFIRRMARGGAIKIGFSIEPQKRLARLQTSSADMLVILGVTPGTIATEKAIHARFKHLRLRGEWFRATDDLHAYIAEVRQ